MREVNTDYYKSAFQQAIPGESLTNDPESPWPWEKPPQYTSMHKACEFLFEKLTEEENYVNLLEVAGNGMPLMNIARVMLTDGFQNGLWNPDLLMTLVEPLVYMMAALLERADIDFVIEYDSDDEGETPDKDIDALRQLQRKSLVPEEIEERISEFKVPESNEQQVIEDDEQVAPPMGVPSSLLERSDDE